MKGLQEGAERARKREEEIRLAEMNKLIEAKLEKRSTYYMIAHEIGEDNAYLSRVRRGKQHIDLGKITEIIWKLNKI